MTVPVDIPVLSVVDVVDVGKCSQVKHDGVASPPIISESPAPAPANISDTLCRQHIVQLLIQAIADSLYLHKLLTDNHENNIVSELISDDGQSSLSHFRCKIF